MAVSRELAVWCTAPGLAELEAACSRPGTTSTLPPVFEHALPADLPDHCVAIYETPGPRDERIFGARGIGIENAGFEVHVRGPRRIDVEPSQVSYDRARTACDAVRHLVAAAQAQVLERDWPEAAAGQISYLLVECFSPVLEEVDGTRRPVWWFRGTAQRYTAAAT